MYENLTLAVFLETAKANRECLEYLPDEVDWHRLTRDFVSSVKRSSTLLFCLQILNTITKGEFKTWVL